MATMRIWSSNATDSFTLASAWKCEPNKQKYGFRFMEGSPTYSTYEMFFNYMLPSGSTIIKSQIWAKIGSIYTGYSVLNVNGNAFTETWQDERGADVSLEGTSGEFTAKFTFKANGTTNGGVDGSSFAYFNDVYLWIEYQEAEGVEPDPEPSIEEQNIFRVPPQSVCLYDQETAMIYTFDGVLKIQHTMSVKIEEEPSKHQDEFVNNARNEPDKVVLDVLMSDVYTDENNMTIAKGWDSDPQGVYYEQTKTSVISDFTRSGNAVYVLRRIKEARKRLAIITPQYVHTDMIISGMTINQDESSPYGWQGQIEFQHAYEPKEKTNDYSSKKGTKLSLTESLSFGLANLISGNKGTTNTSNSGTGIKLNQGNTANALTNSLRSGFTIVSGVRQTIE